MYTKEEIAAMTPAEQAIARDMNAAEEAGEDPFGDEFEGEATAAEAPAAAPAAAPAPAPTAEDEPNDDANDGEPAAAPAPAAAAPAPAAAAPAEPPAPAAAPAPAEQEAAEEAPTAFQVQDTKPITEQRKQLRADKQQIEKDWAAGTISDEDRATKLGEIDDKMDALLIQQTRAETLQEVNVQNFQREVQSVIGGIRTEGKAVGLDYGTAEQPTAAAHQFDRMMAALDADPTWQGKSFTDRAREAHRGVLALNGKLAAPPAPAAAPAPAAKREAPPAPPQTLREIPAAERANTGDDMAEQWKAATGAAADRLWNRMTPAQQARALQDE